MIIKYDNIYGLSGIGNGVNRSRMDMYYNVGGDLSNKIMSEGKFKTFFKKAWATNMLSIYFHKQISCYKNVFK